MDRDTVNKVLSQMTIGEFQNTSKADIISLIVPTVDMSIKRTKGPDYGEQCRKCGKTNHYVRVCQNTERHVHHIGGWCRRGDNSVYVGMIQGKNITGRQNSFIQACTYDAM